MILLAAALLLAPVAAEQRSPPTWTVESDGSANIMAGFVAFGADADLKRLANAAEKLKLQTAHINKDETPEGLPELMVVFDASISREVALALFNAASRGEYGSLKIGSMLMPVEAAKP
jgi:hypothetical protein